ncbi:MAG: ribokinase [Caldilineales bacterium]|nr:ribokinase [Caldilineales bacterium]
MKKQPTIAVIGSIVADIVVETEHLPRSGENLHVTRVESMIGGKAANAAVTFARLGGRVHLLGNTGDDLFGEQARAALQAEGVETAGLGRDPDHPTGAGILLNEPDGQTAFMIAPGANQTLKPHDLRSALEPLLPELDGLLFNFESPENCLLLAADMAHMAGVPIYVDAGPYRPYSSQLWRHAAVLTPNQPETEALVGHAIRDDASAHAAGDRLRSQGPQSIVIKLGERGALLSTPLVREIHPAFDIEVQDSAGAGDAFTAGLVWSLCQRQSIRASVRFANACGAIAASRFGTMPAMPWLTEVESLLREQN